ncbi:MAG: Hsp20/alpha crystallin family protein [Promethearchaeota archaeon]
MSDDNDNEINKNKKNKGKKKKKKDFSPNFPFGFNPFEQMSDEDRENFNKEFRNIFKQMGNIFGNQAENVDFASMMEEFMQNLMNKENMEEFFKNLGINFDDIMKNAIFSNMDPNELNKLIKKRGGVKINKPLVFGMNVKIGPDGIPKFEPFGHIKKSKTEPDGEKYKFNEIREPLTEVIEEEDEVIIVAEMPGCIKEKMKFEANEKNLTIKGFDEEGKQKFEANIELPCEIIPNYAKANYRNGILEVRLNKKK